MAQNYFLIKNTIVQNIVYAEQEFIDAISSQYDLIIPQDQIQQADACIGYKYSNNTFTKPVDLSPLSIQDQIQIKIAKLIFAFNQLSGQFAAENVLMGITQLGKTKLIADILAGVLRYGQSGSLYEVLNEIDRIVVTAEMAPFITAARLSEMKIKIQGIIASV